MLIVGNWKAYVESRDDAKDIMAAAKRAAGKTRAKLVVCPPAPYIGMLAGDKRAKVAVGAQDISETTVGAATGEVAGGALKRAGASYVIVGHSERRARGENDALVAAKAQRSLANGLTPILCIGESSRDRDAQYLSVLRAQLAAVYGPLSPRERLGIVVAYEPVWAIGKTATDAIQSADLAEMILYIRKVLSEYLPGKNASKVRILYGGSVEPSNIRELATGARVDGFLVGRASADPKIFAALVKALS